MNTTKSKPSHTQPPARSRVAASEWLNPSQIAVLETYDRGEFNHLVRCATQEEFDAQLAQCGDSLLRFLMTDLSEQQGCTSSGDAISQINGSISRLKEALAGAYNAQDWFLDATARSALQKDPILNTQ
ncbi:hypothetical protein [Paraburkholderia sp. SIMBA_054]|uniref:hypothetical protein n=1 Tax=Paraburkholderia sp. SIMBA_054 TaxID=3085795 RepID=UPI00397C1CAA